MGFEFVKNTEPNYFYVIGNERHHRYNFRKNILMEKYNCPENMTEHDFCSHNNWYRIYDCGNKLYELNLQSNG